MRRQAPPLEATEAFLAAARAPSFRAAADTIALSPSAFSRRIQLLENFVGAPLFDRSGPTIRLTDAGRLYFAEVSPALDAIRRATMQLRERATSRTLRLATSHSFAVGWLIPRLHGLFAAHGIEIDLAIGRDVQQLRSGDVDIAIWGGRSDLSDLPQEKLVELRAVLASPPVFADGRRPPTCAAELAGHHLLTAAAPQRYWDTWLAVKDPAHLIPEPSTRFETTDLCYEAAAGGLGVTLAVPLLSDRFVADGRLIGAMGPPVPLGLDYRLFFATPEIARRTSVQLLSQWLRGEVAASVDGYDRWVEAAERPGVAATVGASR